MAPGESWPRVGLGVLVLKNGKLLLGKRRGSHGEGEYASPGGHLEHLEGFAACAAREVREETGCEIANVRFLRVLNVTAYAPKHYVDLAFSADWVSGEPRALEPEKVEAWGWYALDALPSPLFATLPTALEALRGEQRCWDARVAIAVR
jgi:8-oxo-dGTP diphosphatase